MQYFKENKNIFTWNIPGSVTKPVLSHEGNVKTLQKAEVSHGPFSHGHVHRQNALASMTANGKEKTRYLEVTILNDSWVKKKKNQNKNYKLLVKKYTMRVSK